MILLLVLSGHAIFKLIYLSNHDYKALYFESDAATVNEIVLKVTYPIPLDDFSICVLSVAMQLMGEKSIEIWNSI